VILRPPIRLHIGLRGQRSLRKLKIGWTNAI
jgi:hypothetical protein